MKVTTLDTQVAEQIGHAFGYYDYGEEVGMGAFYRSIRRRTGSVHKQSRQSNGHHRGFSFHDNHNVKLMLQI